MLKYEIIEREKLLKNFPEIYNQIEKYYGFDNNGKDSARLFSDFPKLDNLIQKFIVDNETYMNFWENGFIKKLKEKVSSREIFATTAGFVPNLSGVIKLNTSLSKRYSTELHFYKSLINNYFSIEVLEIDNQKEINHSVLGKKNVIDVCKITVSPVGEFKSLFLDVYELLNSEFDDSKFIPFYFDLMKVKGLNTIGDKNVNETVSQAFFRKYSKFDETRNVIGDINYKIDKL